MRSVATLPIVATSSIAHSASVTNADRRLLELAPRIAEIQALYDAAVEQENEAQQAYTPERKPMRPAALIWQPGDPVTYDRGDDVPLGPPGRVWCLNSDIEQLRDNPLMRWEFVGTDEDWQREESHAWDHANRGPASEAARFWTRVRDTKQQARADELMAALERWERALEHWERRDAKLQRKLGIPRLQEKSEALLEQLSSLQEEMLELQATTIEGLRAKAVVLFNVLWQGDALDELSDTMDSKFILSLVGDLIGSRDLAGAWEGDVYREPTAARELV
ncbi:hypothetical protein [Bradyrhizobium sp. USDA 3364]